MLEVQNLRWTPPGAAGPLLQNISFRLPAAHLAAVIGPSGCGKSTLLRLLAGIHEPDGGRVTWSGFPGCRPGPGAVGYAPQFSIAHELLTARESVQEAVRLRVACGRREADSRVRSILAAAGLEDAAGSLVRVLSGGQRRRLALAMELASDPGVLLCDEVTSGLDPRAEREITGLLLALARYEGRLVISVTHSLAHISRFDSVIVMHAGRVVFHGPPGFLAHYFHATHPEEIYPRLAKRTPDEWLASWAKHSPAYERLMAGGGGEPASAMPDGAAAETGSEEEEPRQTGREAKRLSGPLPPVIAEGPPPAGGEFSTESAPPAPETSASAPSACLPRQGPPGPAAQFAVLLRRRLRLFLRDRAGLALQAALVFGFPLLVALFALNGLPQIRNLSMSLDTGLVQQLQEAYDYVVESTRAGSLVSGLVMLQVILLGLAAANNAAREVAATRAIIEKEKLAGLSPGADLAARAVFLALLVLAQSVWMAWFVDAVCRFPGSFVWQTALLALLNGAITAASLAISSWSRSPERASLLAVYLVGFQLPLSGALLALPDFAAWISRPFIASYWAWSGLLQTMRHTRHYDVAAQVSQTPLSPFELCVWALCCHIVIALALARVGLRRKSWPE